ncbi:MAG: hypothetical protein RIC30_05810 [Marinoscillum sp.]|uniref:hypothetical protein n=1 Tax=Marinoscillum sp. TaxID=2024838 RepID=UPI0033035D57
MSFFTRILIAVICLTILASLSSCTATNAKNYSWTDLQHSRDLDKKKGKQSKKYQRSFVKAHDY